VPVLEETWTLASEGMVPGGAYRNMQAYGDSISFEDEWNIDNQLVFTDPQTNGGLLISVDPERADDLVAHIRRSGFPHTAIIGKVSAARGSDAPVVFWK
jgi:selenide,water dikinase